MAIIDLIAVVVGLFIISIFYIMGSAIITEGLRPGIDEAGFGNITSEQVEVYDNLINMWNMVMLIFVFGILFFGFVSASRRDSDVGGSGLV